LKKFFDIHDPREMVFQMLTIYTENYVPGTLHRRIKKIVEDDWIQSYMLFIGHKSFSKYYIFNFDFIVGEQIKAFPKMMDLPEFEKISYLTDCQRIEDILWCDGIEKDEQGLLLDGRRIAVWDKYHAFMQWGGFDIKKFNIPERDVMVATEDIYCPRRNRQVIYKGCAYEAPAYLSVVRHRKISNQERKILQHMLQDTMSDLPRLLRTGG
jgi:hypothetical protein